MCARQKPRRGVACLVGRRRRAYFLCIDNFQQACHPAPAIPRRCTGHITCAQFFPTMETIRATTASMSISVESRKSASSAGLSGGVLARGVAGIAAADTGEYGVVVRFLALRLVLLDAAAGTLGILGRQEHLDIGIGNTTVPISLPSSTESRARPKPRCTSSSAARTSGCAEAREAASDTAGVRISAPIVSPLHNRMFRPSRSSKRKSRSRAISHTPCRPLGRHHAARRRRRQCGMSAPVSTS